MKKIRFCAAALAVLLAGTACLAGCGAEPAQPQSQTVQTSSVAQEPRQTYLYRLKVQNTGEDTDTETYLQIAERSWQAFRVLEESAGLMLMDAYNYQDIDGEGTPLYAYNTLKYPEEIAPNGRSIRVNVNYLRHNPIATADGQDLLIQIADSDTELYVLVPEKYRSMEEDIRKAYREDFYFEKVTAENDYNEMAARPERSPLTMEDLSVNIIYVKDGQKYNTYRPGYCAAADGGWVTDPVVKVYTSNIHCNYAHSFLSQWSYFYSEQSTPEEAYQEILEPLKRTNHEKSIQQVELVADNH